MTHAEKVARASELYLAGRTLLEIAQEMRRNQSTVRLWIIEAGVKIRKRGPRNGGFNDPALDLPIGQLPAGHPFAAFDAEMIAARDRKYAYDGGLGASSIALCGEAAV